MGKKKKNKLFIGNKMEDRDRYNPIFSSEEEMANGVNAYLESIYGSAVARRQDLPEGYPVPTMANQSSYQGPTAADLFGARQNFTEDKHEDDTSFMQNMLSRSTVAQAIPVEEKTPEPTSTPVFTIPRFGTPENKGKIESKIVLDEEPTPIMETDSTCFGKPKFIIRDLSGNVLMLPRLKEAIPGVKWTYPKHNGKSNEEAWKNILANSCLDFQAYCGAPDYVIDMDEFMDLTSSNGIHGYDSNNMRILLHGTYLLIYDIAEYRKNGNPWRAYLDEAGDMNVAISAIIQAFAILYEKRYIGFEQTAEFMLDNLASETDLEDTSLLEFLKRNQIDEGDQAYEDITDISAISFLDNEITATFEFISEMSRDDDESESDSEESNPYDQYPNMTESDLENFANDYKNENLGYLAPREGGASTNDAPFPGSAADQSDNGADSETSQPAEEAVQRGAAEPVADGSNNGYTNEGGAFNVSSEHGTTETAEKRVEGSTAPVVGSVENAVEQQQKAEKEERKENLGYQQTSRSVRKEEAQKEEVDEDEDSLIIPVTKGPR